MINEYDLEYVITQDYGISWLFETPKNKIDALELSNLQNQLDSTKHYANINNKFNTVEHQSSILFV